MAKTFDPEALQDAKRENSKESKKFNSAPAPGVSESNQNPDPASPNSAENTKTNSENTTKENTGFTIPGQKEEPIRDEFKERYDAYFKNMGGVLAGGMVVDMVDELKTSFLYLYAVKNGIDVGKEALQMDPKSKAFAAFLVDEAVKNNFFEWIKKYPLLAGLAVILISGGSTFLMLQMLKKSNDESKKKDDIIDKLRREKAEAERRNATDVKDMNADENLKEFIKKV